MAPKSRESRIFKALQAALSPVMLHVHDDSAKHAGHAGAQPEGETHYRLVIVSQAFEGMKNLERHRRVNALLQNEFDSGLHALQIKALTSDEHQKSGGAL